MRPGPPPRRTTPASSAIAFHPRSAAVHHKGTPDYELAARLAAELPVPVILSGGLREAAAIRRTFADTGVAAVMLARGALGNPWLFAQTLGLREDEPTRGEVLDELDWVMDRAVEHLGPDRAARYLRKFYPWYLTRMGEGKLAQEALQRTASTGEAKALLAGPARRPGRGLTGGYTAAPSCRRTSS